MLPFRIAICEDDPPCRIHTMEMIEKWLHAHCSRKGEVIPFENGQALLDALSRGEQFDLYLLDILMPGPNGIQTGTALRQLEESGEIIYLTSTPDFAVESYTVGAFFYLLKPVEEKMLFALIDKAAARLELRQSAGIIIQTTKGACRALLDDILYVEKVGRRAKYVCTDEILESLSLQTSFKEAIQPLLSDRRFCPCGASFLLNLQRVRRVEGQTAYLTGGVKLTLPRTACAEFKGLWGEYWLKGGDQ